MGIDQKTLNSIIARLTAVAQVERIILFGSAARDEMTADSDLDLLILEKSPENTRKESILLRKALRGMGYPFDIIVMSTQRFEETKDIFGGIAWPANKYGKTIYETA